MIASANSDGQDEAERDAGGELLRGGRGCDEQREDEQHTRDLGRRGDRQTEHDQERDVDQADRDAARVGGWLVDRAVEQRPAGDQEEGEHGDCDGRERVHLAGRDAEERAEQQCLEVLEDAAVEAEEEKPERERGCLDGSGHRRLLREVAPPRRA